MSSTHDKQTEKVLGSETEASSSAKDKESKDLESPGKNCGFLTSKKNRNFSKL